MKLSKNINSSLFCKLFSLLNILKVINGIWVYTDIIVATLIKSRLIRWKQRILSSWIFRLLELIKLFFNVTIIFSCILCWRHEFTHEGRHFTHWNASNFICTWLTWIYNFLNLFLRKCPFLFKYFVLLFLLGFRVFRLELTHKFTHQVCGTFRRFFNLFLFLCLLTLILLGLFSFNLFFYIR